MTKNPRSPQAVDRQRHDDQQKVKIKLKHAMTHNNMPTMEKLWDELVDITEIRCRARQSGWLPLKGE